jgi:hypothetical protein
MWGDVVSNGSTATLSSVNPILLLGGQVYRVSDGFNQIENEFKFSILIPSIL